MAHTIQGQKPLLARVRRIRGQTEALERALTDGKECGAVLQQIAAIRGAVNGLMAEVLEGHIREHLGVQDVTDRQRRDDTELVVSALRSYLK
jgi:FrmR/RcnR family transcriptional regulator, repressor of frmRAB operon